MNEQFPVPQADRLIAKEGDNRMGVEKDGEFITDPKEVFRLVFEEQRPEDFRGLELEKTEQDNFLIEHALSAVKEYAGIYGRATFGTIPYNHIHLVKEGGTSLILKQPWDGSHSTVLGEIIVDRARDVPTAITLFHELWHRIGSYNAVQIRTTDGDIDWYRSGIAMKSRDGEEEWFRTMNEALTGYMTWRYANEILKETEEFQGEIAEYVREEKYVNTTREGEVDDLMEVVDEVIEKSNGLYESREEVLDIFIRAQVTGNVLPIARILDNVYGKGSFRKFGEL